MNSIVNSPDVLAAIRQRKLAIRQRMKASRQQMTERASRLTGGPVPQAANRFQNISRLVTSAFVIYRGFRLCSSILTSLRSIFSPRKRRR